MSSDGYKETEIGMIPEEWDFLPIKKIDNSKEAVKTGPFGSLLHSYDYADEGVPLLLVKNIVDGRVVSEGIPLVNFDKANTLKKFWLQEGDIVFTRVGAVGRTLYITKKQEGWMFSGQTLRLRIKKPDINNKFIEFYFRTPQYQAIIEMTSLGSTRASINTSILADTNIPIPSKYEQDKIVEIISSLDKKIQLNHQMNQTLESIGQAIFRHWFVHFEFPDENGHPYESSGGELVDSELGEIPAGWEVREIGNVIETTGGGTPSTKNEEYWENGNIQWFSPRDITGNNQMFITNSEKMINEVGLKKSSANLFPPYSLMMTSRATVGELSINTQEASTNQGFITCIPNDKLSTYYLYFWLKMNKENIISLASGSTFREINKSTFRSLKIIIPSNSVLSKYNSILKPLFYQIKTLQGQNKELSQFRDSLLPKLMSGKIRVPMEASND